MEDCNSNATLNLYLPELNYPELFNQHDLLLSNIELNTVKKQNTLSNDFKAKISSAVNKKIFYRFLLFWLFHH